MDPQIPQIRTARPRHDLEPLRIPGPANGMWYSAPEVAELLGRSKKTIRDWIATGLMRHGQRVKLRSMRVPRGCISPAELCRFLEAINEQKVEVQNGGIGRDDHVHADRT